MKYRIVFLLLVIIKIFTFSYATESVSISSEASDYLELIEPYSVEEDLQKSTIIVIESKSKKMDVYLNGVYQGRTQLTISNLLPGEYILELRKENKSTGKVLITVKKGYILTYKF